VTKYKNIIAKDIIHAQNPIFTIANVTKTRHNVLPVYLSSKDIKKKPRISSIG
jgi:hypothetical protein